MVKFESLKSDILDRIPLATAVLNSRSDVVFAYLFGGLPSGRVNPLSDIDIAVYVREDGAQFTKLSLFNVLTDALQTSELDLVVLNTAPISLTGRILSRKKNLVDKDPFLRHCYESQTLRQYFDFQWIESDFFNRRFGDGDRNLIFRKTDDLDTYQRQLLEFTGTGLEDYLGDWKSRRVVERTLQMMIETCTDIANHLILDDGLRAPNSYADCFIVLREHGVISEALAPKRQ